MVLRNFFVLLTLIAVCVVDAGAKSGSLTYFKPAAFDREAAVLVSGKMRNYYVLEADTKIELQVKGPSRLMILSRAVADEPSESVKYKFLALRKKSRKALSISHESHTSDKVVFSGDREGHISFARKKYIDVPKGDHTYTIYLPKGAKGTLLMRFARETTAFTSGTQVVAMTPAEFTTQVDLVAREESTTYYRIGTGYGSTVELIGPATLKVLSRIEYDANMSGKQKWRVRVLEDGRVKGTYSLASRKSGVTTYREPSSLVASQAETFFVEIPEGKHRYEFVLPENHRTVLLKFLLPKSQLERE
ncbi:hypothetical protein KKH27_06800 [bacterium]|nr:hypothetical protein [bacterium]MBU1983745.1 hypothetical protein [bacterium]